LPHLIEKSTSLPLPERSSRRVAPRKCLQTSAPVRRRGTSLRRRGRQAVEIAGQPKSPANAAEVHGQFLERSSWGHVLGTDPIQACENRSPRSMRRGSPRSKNKAEASPPPRASRRIDLTGRILVLLQERREARGTRRREDGERLPAVIVWTCTDPVIKPRRAARPRLILGPGAGSAIAFGSPRGPQS
jgi:hypothetical protein